MRAAAMQRARDLYEDAQRRSTSALAAASAAGQLAIAEQMASHVAAQTLAGIDARRRHGEPVLGRVDFDFDPLSHLKTALHAFAVKGPIWDIDIELRGQARTLFYAKVTEAMAAAGFDVLTWHNVWPVITRRDELQQALASYRARGKRKYAGLVAAAVISAPLMVVPLMIGAKAIEAKRLYTAGYRYY